MLARPAQAGPLAAVAPAAGVEGATSWGVLVFLALVIPPGAVKALIELRKDFGFMRFAREMRDSAIRHGLIVLVGAFVVGLISAVVYKFSGGKIG